MICRKSSIIVINYGRSDLLLNFLESVRDSTDSRLISEVIVVDNGYPQKGDSREVVDISSFAFKLKFVQNPKSSYASGVNRGVALASEDTLIISNNDIELLPQFSIQPLLDYLWREPRIGIAGPQLIYPDGTWQRSYGKFPSLKEAVLILTMADRILDGANTLVFRHNRLSRRHKMVEYIDGAFMLVRRSCFDELHGFDESYSFYGEDADLCCRARQANWKVSFLPAVRVMHVRGASSSADALQNYTVRLIRAKQKFVRDHLGPRRARWYKRVIQAALFKRKWLYRLAALLIRSHRWQQRAIEATIRYRAIRENP